MEIYHNNLDANCARVVSNALTILKKRGQDFTTYWHGDIIQRLRRLQSLIQDEKPKLKKEYRYDEYTLIENARQNIYKFLKSQEAYKVKNGTYEVFPTNPNSYVYNEEFISFCK